MLNLRSFAKWVRGILDSEEAYNLPEDVYNDVIPSAVHGLLPLRPGVLRRYRIVLDDWTRTR